MLEMWVHVFCLHRLPLVDSSYYNRFSEVRRNSLLELCCDVWSLFFGSKEFLSNFEVSEVTVRQKEKKSGFNWRWLRITLIIKDKFRKKVNFLKMRRCLSKVLKPWQTGFEKLLIKFGCQLKWGVEKTKKLKATCHDFAPLLFLSSRQ